MPEPIRDLPFDPANEAEVRQFYEGSYVDGVYVPRGEPGTDDHERPPFVQTDHDARRWDMAATIAAATLWDPREPLTPGVVWRGARALYFSKEVPTG
jgi:hypothetical protein